MNQTKEKQERDGEHCITYILLLVLCFIFVFYSQSSFLIQFFLRFCKKEKEKIKHNPINNCNIIHYNHH
jgi:hypothetical protein